MADGLRVDPRHVSPLVGALNFRDLGGLPAGPGLMTRRGRLFRSDTLQALTAGDVDWLLGEAGLRAIVDLRLADEVAEEGRGPLASRPDVAYVNAPLAMASADGLAPEAVLDALYLGTLAPGSMLAPAVERLAAFAGEPTLFHCAAGKDRTGLLAAVVLRLLGVDDEWIVADYMASAHNMPAMLVRFATWPRYRDHMAATPPQVYAVDEGPIRRFLSEIDRRHGSVRGWALAHGVGAAAMARLVDALLVPR